jgi:uncharacterized membrane protein
MMPPFIAREDGSSRAVQLRFSQLIVVPITMASVVQPQCTAPPPAAAPHHKEVVMKWTSWCNLILGIWLIISPWVIGFPTSAATGITFVVGIAVLIAAIVALSSYEAARGARWLNLILGIWVVISPWVLRFATSSNATASNVIAGALVVIFAWIGLAMRRRLPTTA